MVLVKFLIFKKKTRIRYRVATYCKRDKIIKNIKSYDNNERHIFRIRALHNIYVAIAREALKHNLALPLEDIRLFRGNLIFYFEKEQKENLICAEVAGSGLLPIKDRLIIHIQALRDLRAGKKVKKLAKKYARKVA